MTKTRKYNLKVFSEYSQSIHRGLEKRFSDKPPRDRAETEQSPSRFHTSLAVLLQFACERAEEDR